MVVTKATKKQVADKQELRCANKPKTMPRGLYDFECPLYENKDGKFGEERYQVDHIIEQALGGSDDMENLQALCHSCHAVKNNNFATLRKEEKKLIYKYETKLNKKLKKLRTKYNGNNVLVVPNELVVLNEKESNKPTGKNKINDLIDRYMKTETRVSKQSEIAVDGLYMQYVAWQYISFPGVVKLTPYVTFCNRLIEMNYEICRRNDNVMLSGRKNINDNFKSFIDSCIKNANNNTLEIQTLCNHIRTKLKGIDDVNNKKYPLSWHVRCYVMRDKYSYVQELDGLLGYTIG